MWMDIHGAETLAVDVNNVECSRGERMSSSLRQTRERVDKLSPTICFYK